MHVFATIKNTIIPSVCLTKILHKHCLQFYLGLTMVPRENKDDAYAKFRDMKTMLMQNLEGRTKSIIIHSKYFPVSDWLKPHA